MTQPQQLNALPRIQLYSQSHTRQSLRAFRTRLNFYLHFNPQDSIFWSMDGIVTISTSTSLPLNLSKSPAGLGISGSGSFQSHLSTSKSHQRLRAGIHSSPGLPYNANSTNILPFNRVTANTASWIPADIGSEIHSSRLPLVGPKSWFQWLLIVYCCLCVVLFTTSIFGFRGRLHLLDSPGTH